MRIILLSLLVACTHSAAPVVEPAPAIPNRACVLAKLIESQFGRSGSCDDMGKNIGPEAVDAIIWRPVGGGAKWCRTSLDPKQPLTCSTLVLSPAEQAAQVEAAKVEAAKAAAATSSASPPPAPVPTPAAPPNPKPKGK